MSLVLLTQYFDTLRDIGTARWNEHALFAQQPRRRGTSSMTQILAGLKGSMNAGSGAGGLGLPVVNPAAPPVVTRELRRIG